MSNVVDFRKFKAARIAAARAETLRDLTEDFLGYTPDGRAWMASYYERMGWASRADIREALKACEEFQKEAGV